ncbi:MAG: triosephosphate isomerase [Microbacteriaceae bacterium]|nr:triosephosphate isomerase [Microbacteriaceae bacterium]
MASPDVRSQLVGASTKAYLSYRETVDWLVAIRGVVLSRPHLAEYDIVPFVIPSLPLIERAVAILDGTGVRVGAQDVSWGSGALTGETPATMVADMGVTIAEVGHYERRTWFGETSHVVHRKYEAAMAAGLQVLLCIGEPRATTPRRAARFCRKQVRAAVEGNPGARLTLAYEPSWAIGAQVPARPSYVNHVVQELRAELRRDYPDADVRIIYGGSAGPGLLGSLPELDGLFLGRFAHQATAFGQVLDEACDRFLR